MAANDGGPAFPTDAYWDEKRYGVRDGMTLRDYFAAKALSAILPTAGTADARRSTQGVQACAHDYAQVAYILADAMLKAREAR